MKKTLTILLTLSLILHVKSVGAQQCQRLADHCNNNLLCCPGLSCTNGFCTSDTPACGTFGDGCDLAPCCTNMGFTCNSSLPINICESSLPHGHTTCIFIGGECHTDTTANYCKDGSRQDLSFCENLGDDENACNTTIVPCLSDTEPPPPLKITNLLCEGNGGINTAIGCIPTYDKTKFFSFILGWAIGIAGGVFLILSGFASFMLITATGDPKKAQAGRELLTAAIFGLILIIYSVFLLNTIGVGILGLIQLRS